MSLIQRYKRRKDREAQRAALLANLETHDADFRFEIACSSVKAVMKKYSLEELLERELRLSMIGAGQSTFNVPQGVSSLNITMIGGGGGGVGSAFGSGGSGAGPKKSFP